MKRPIGSTPALRVVECPQCGTKVERYASQILARGARFCSIECRKAATVTTRAATCAHCGASYQRAHQHIGRDDAGKYCSRACYFAAVEARKQRPITRVCPACGEEFTVPARLGRRVYCSRPCQAKGRVRTESEKSRGPGWRARAEEVRVRDERRCVRCDEPELPRRRHAVDHVVPWIIAKGNPAAANADENLATLCHPCHGIKTTKIEPRIMRGDWLALAEFYGPRRAKAAMRVAIPDTPTQGVTDAHASHR